MDGWLGFLAIFIGLIIVVLIWWFGGINESPPPSSTHSPTPTPTFNNTAIPVAPVATNSVIPTTCGHNISANVGTSTPTPPNSVAPPLFSPILPGATPTPFASNDRIVNHSHINQQSHSPLELMSTLAQRTSVPITVLQPWSNAYSITISTLSTFNPLIVKPKDSMERSAGPTIEELPDEYVMTEPQISNLSVERAELAPVTTDLGANVQNPTPTPNYNSNAMIGSVDDNPLHLQKFETITPAPASVPASASVPTSAPAIVDNVISSTHQAPIIQQIPEQPIVSHNPVIPNTPPILTSGKIYIPNEPRERSRHEIRCNEILEEYYGRSFAPIWHPQIINDTGYLLELDCFNEELQLALEYNGIQHYQWPNYTGMSEMDFKLLVKRDAYKKKRCAELGIYLIVVPHWVEYHHLRKYIHERLPENRVRSG